MRYTTRPLSGWDGPRTPGHQRRSRWAFRAGWQSTLDLLERELEHLDARDVVLEADFREQDLRLDGMPRSNAREPQDPGIRLAFGSKHGDLVYQCDSVDGWRENVRSIALGLQALRAVDRYGITRHAEQYRGWKQIGGGAAVVPDAPPDREQAAVNLVSLVFRDGPVAPRVADLLAGRLDLTVKQPWSWASVHGGKDVENRTRNIAGAYRGPVAIHAGLCWSDEAGPWMDERALATEWDVDPRALTRGVILGVVDLVDVHHSDDCWRFDNERGEVRMCSPWAMDGHHHHLVLANPRPLLVPIPATGRLGLWTPTDDVARAILEQAA